MKTDPGQAGARNAEAQPMVSVVVPTYNAGDWLERCLAGLTASDWPALEIIVIDDASPTQAAREAAERHGVRYLRLDRNSGPAVARNHGVEAAAGDLIMTVDADVVVHPDTVRKGVEVLLAAPEVGAVFGSYDEHPGHPAFLSQYRNLYHRWVHQQGDSEASTFWTGCGLVRRQAFDAAGGFGRAYDRPSIEDIEFGYRLRDQGWKIRLRKDMNCTHLKDWGLVDMVRTDIFRRGVPWMALLLRRGKDEAALNTNPRAKIATVAAAALVPVLLAAVFWPPLLWLGLLLVGLIVALQWGFYREIARLKGIAFAFAVVPAQVLFFLCCAAAIPLGYLRYLSERRSATA
ncbi:MAG: glycosyltransferase family 2 protein [Pseudomonadota bacterium]